MAERKAEAKAERVLERREKRGVERDAEGRAHRVLTDAMVLDPESDLAVQIPEELRQQELNPLEAHAEKSALEVLAEHEERSDESE